MQSGPKYDLLCTSSLLSTSFLLCHLICIASNLFICFLHVAFNITKYNIIHFLLFMLILEFNLFQLRTNNLWFDLDTAFMTFIFILRTKPIGTIMTKPELGMFGVRSF